MTFANLNKYAGRCPAYLYSPVRGGRLLQQPFPLARTGYLPSINAPSRGIAAVYPPHRSIGIATMPVGKSRAKRAACHASCFACHSVYHGVPPMPRWGKSSPHGVRLACGGRGGLSPLAGGAKPGAGGYSLRSVAPRRRPRPHSHWRAPASEGRRVTRPTPARNGGTGCTS